MAALVYITCADQEEAKKIARTLVEEKLVAGASLIPALSVYRWQGEVMEAGETLILAHSLEECFEELCRRVRELHSYECPCLELLPLRMISPDFGAWIEDSCRAGKEDGI